MTTHTCPRCGHESRCSYGNWYDRHTTATIILATFAIVFTLVVVVGYPWLLLVGAVGYVVYVIDREYRRRRALAARADWEFRRLMEQPVLPPPHTPDSSGGMRKRPRGVDHWSITRPIRRRRK